MGDKVTTDELLAIRDSYDSLMMRVAPVAMDSQVVEILSEIPAMVAKCEGALAEIERLKESENCLECGASDWLCLACGDECGDDHSEEE